MIVYNPIFDPLSFPIFDPLSFAIQLALLKRIYKNVLVIRVLGLPDSGKTQFTNALRNSNNNTEQSISFFEYTYKDKKNYINATDTCGRSTKDIIKQAKSYVEIADYLFIFCDITKYLNNSDSYQNEINIILRATCELAEKKSVKIFVLLSHSDKLKKLHMSIEQGVDNFKKCIKGSPYQNVRCYAINTNHQDEVRTLFNTIVYEH